MPTRVRVKICGVRTPEIARAAADAGADAIGVVFAASSPRYVTREEAAAVVAAVPAFVETVGLFVTPDAEEILATAEALGLSMVQLHGPTVAELVEELWPRRVIAAAAFDPATGDETLYKWDQLHAKFNNLAAVLFDTPDAKAQGGTGRSFDWAALRGAIDRVKPRVPVILAGGLTPTNVAEAAKVVRPWAVDVSSGVESSRGIKDAGKIESFCAAVATSQKP